MEVFDKVPVQVRGSARSRVQTASCRWPRPPISSRSIVAATEPTPGLVRMPGVVPLNRCICVSAGTEADLAIFAEELPKALADVA